MFKSAEIFVGRLSEVEKIRLRASATEDRTRWLFDTVHRYEFDLPEDAAWAEFKAALQLVQEKFKADSRQLGFSRTWTF